MKKTALTTGAITLLGQGVGLATLTSSPSGSTEPETRPKRQLFTITLWAKFKDPLPESPPFYDWVPDQANGDTDMDTNNGFPGPYPHPGVDANKPKVDGNEMTGGEVFETTTATGELTSVTIDAAVGEQNPDTGAAQEQHIHDEDGRLGVAYTITVTYHYADEE